MLNNHFTTSKRSGLNFAFWSIVYVYIVTYFAMSYISVILGVVKRNPLFLHEIEWKNNGFLFTTPNIYCT